jgi:hypothetical protein
MTGGALFALLALAGFFDHATAQGEPGPPPSSWPKNYSGIPSENYSPAWQSCASSRPLPSTWALNYMRGKRLSGHAATSKRFLPARP